MKPINSEYAQRLLRDYPDAQYLQDMHDKIMSRAPYPEAGERDYEFFLWAELHRHQRAVWANKRYQMRNGPLTKEDKRTLWRSAGYTLLIMPVIYPILVLFFAL